MATQDPLPSSSKRQTDDSRRELARDTLAKATSSTFIPATFDEIDRGSADRVLSVVRPEDLQFSIEASLNESLGTGSTPEPGLTESQTEAPETVEAEPPPSVDPVAAVELPEVPAIPTGIPELEAEAANNATPEKSKGIIGMVQEGRMPALPNSNVDTPPSKPEPAAQVEPVENAVEMQPPDLPRLELDTVEDLPPLPESLTPEMPQKLEDVLSKKQLEELRQKRAEEKANPESQREQGQPAGQAAPFVPPFVAQDQQLDMQFDAGESLEGFADGMNRFSLAVTIALMGLGAKLNTYADRIEAMDVDEFLDGGSTWQI